MTNSVGFARLLYKFERVVVQVVGGAIACQCMVGLPARIPLPSNPHSNNEVHDTLDTRAQITGTAPRS